MGSRKVVVLDTNVLVSAVGWRGPERRLYELCRAGMLRGAISPVLLVELERVLRYPKMRLNESDIHSFVQEICSHALIVEPQRVLDAVDSDPDDNRVIECAVTAGAQWIVSGDKHLLRMESFNDIQIVTTAVALRRLDVPS